MKEELRKNIEIFLINYENDLSERHMEYYNFDVQEANSLLSEAVELLTKVVN